MRAGSQLRLLHSLEPQGRQLAQQLTGVAEQEMTARWRQQHQQQAATPSGAAQTHTGTSFPAMPVPATAAQGGEEPPEEAQRGCWLSLAGGVAATAVAEAAEGSHDLQLVSSSLPQAVRISEEQDAARAAAVDGWLARMALQRRLAEHVLAAEQDSRAAAQRDRQVQLAAQQAEALSRQQSSKAALLRGQRAALREQRARVAAQHEQQATADRQDQLLTARREHAAAVAELERALGKSGLQASEPASQGRASASPAAGDSPAATTAAAPAAPAPAVAAAAAAQPPAVKQAAGAAPASQIAAHDVQQVAMTAGQQQGEGPCAEAPQRVPPASLPPLKLSRVQLLEHCQGNARPQPADFGYPPACGAGQPLLPGPLGPPAPAAQPGSSRRLLMMPPPLKTARGIGAWQAEAAAAATQGAPEHGASVQEEEEEEEAVVLAPLSAVLECCVTQSVLSQYRAVSRACVRCAQGRAPAFCEALLTDLRSCSDVQQLSTGAATAAWAAHSVSTSLLAIRKYTVQTYVVSTF